MDKAVKEAFDSLYKTIFVDVKDPSISVTEDVFKIKFAVVRELTEKMFAQQQNEMTEKVEYYERILHDSREIYKDEVKDLKQTVEEWQQKFHAKKRDEEKLVRLVQHQATFIGRYTNGGDFE